MNTHGNLAPNRPRHWRSFVLPLVLTLLVAAPLATAAHAGEHSRGKSALDLSMPLSFLGAMGATMTISCDTDADRDTQAAIRALSGRGSSGRYAWTDEDGSRLVAQRDGGRFRLKVTDDDDKTVTLEMPWNVAQCLLSGGTSGPRRMSLASLQRDGGFSLKVNGEDSHLHIQMR